MEETSESAAVERPLPDNVKLLSLEGRSIYLVGTAHVSAKSVELVESVLRELRPDTVAVELCEPRLRALKDPESWRKTDVVKVIREGKAFLLLSQLMLASFQKKIGERLGVQPGAEMLKAIDVAEELGIRKVLADREVSITLRRTWRNLGFWGGAKMLAALLTEGLAGGEEVDEEEIERLKTSDVLEEAMQDFAKALPSVRESLIDERDRYLAEKIRTAPGEKIVAIVGAGHVPGIERYIHEATDLAPLETIPPPSKWTKVIAWAIPLVILGLILYGLLYAGTDVGVQMLFDWIWVNALFGVIGALVAFGHPLTVLSAGLVSPITSANPFVASGWIAGLVEASVRKPKVEDFEQLSGSALTMRIAWTNRVTRVLLVVVFTNLFGTVGTFLSGGLIASRL